jgi:hypothetical protein
MSMLTACQAGDLLNNAYMCTQPDVHGMHGMRTVLICLMLLRMQTLMDAQATLVCRTPFPAANALMWLSLALATRAPAKRVHTGALASAKVCAGATSYDGL